MPVFGRQHGRKVFAIQGSGVSFSCLALYFAHVWFGVKPALSFSHFATSRGKEGRKEGVRKTEANQHLSELLYCRISCKQRHDKS